MHRPEEIKGHMEMSKYSMQKNMRHAGLRICTAVSMILALVMMTGASLAWYGELRDAKVSISGSVSYVARYFESGDGSCDAEIVRGYGSDGSPVFNTKPDGSTYTEEEHKASDTPAAYEIKTQEQLYNLAWLQYLGYFNDNAVYFYLSADLDMTGWVLPPIGTTEYPFVGSFDGNGYTISNLTVSNRAAGTDMAAGSGADSEMPIQVKEELAKDGADDLGDEAQIIGLFGAVGDYTGGATYSSAISTVKDVRIDGITIETKTQKALAGLAAGYVNGTLSGVAVSNGTINNAAGAGALDAAGMTDKLSDYTLVGYCEEAYKDKLDVVTTQMTKPTLAISREDASEQGDAWGGSIDMLSLYNRIEYMESNGTNPTYYATETTVTQADGSSVTTYSNPQIISQYVRNYTTEKAGSATLAAYSTSAFTSSYNYLLGSADMDVTKTYVHTIYSHEEVGAVIASDGTHYLNATTTEVVTGTDEATATKWVFSGTDSGTLETYIDDEVYYLNRTGSGLTIGSDKAAATKWVREGNRIYTSSGDKSYFLKYDTSIPGWALTEVVNRSYITDGEHYMVYTGSGSTVTGTDAAGDASAWYVYENADGNYVISTNIGGTEYYLYNSNGTLIASSSYTSSTATAWIKDEQGRLYSDYTYWGTTTRYYISYAASSASWTLTQSISGYIFSDGQENYVTVSSSRTFGATTDAEEAAVWNITSGNNGYRVSTEVDGTTYYLYLSGNTYSSYTLALSTNGSVSNSTWSAYTYYGSTYYYIQIGRGRNKYYYVLHMDGTGLTYSRSQDWWSAVENASFATEQVNKASSDAAVLTFKATNVPPEELELTSAAAQRPTTTETTTTATGKAAIPDTYLPLTADTQANGYAVKDVNTGYIVSGSNYHGPNWPLKSGDIRVSRYAISSIRASYNSSSRTFSTIYTINDSGIQSIPSSNTFVKYEDSSEKLLGVLSGQSYVYGLHFIDAEISKDDVVTIPKATVDFHEHMNYKVPRHSIDFNLRESGYINFFAGEYFSGNSSFFTLHQIFRDETTQEITDIKEISQVYSTADDGVYVYLYNDGTYSSDAAPVEKLFDMAWIGYNASISSSAYRLFYFEIPANNGEYALGSVSGSDGGYLLYLDLSTNAQELRKQELTEVTTVTRDTYTYPRGVQLVASGDAYTSDTDSACVGIAAGSVSSASISRSGDKATLTVSRAGLGTGAFVGDGISLEDSNGDTLTMTATATAQDVTEKVTVYTYNLTTKATTFAVTTTKEATDAAGGMTRTAQRYTYTDWEGGIGTQDTEYTDDGHVIATGDTVIRYHCYDTDKAAVEIASYPALLTNDGISTIQPDDYPAMGAAPVDKSSELSDYIISATSDKAITIRGDEVTSPYSAQLNGTQLDAGSAITVPAT